MAYGFCGMGITRQQALYHSIYERFVRTRTITLVPSGDFNMPIPKPRIQDWIEVRLLLLIIGDPKVIGWCDPHHVSHARDPRIWHVLSPLQRPSHQLILRLFRQRLWYVRSLN